MPYNALANLCMFEILNIYEILMFKSVADLVVSLWPPLLQGLPLLLFGLFILLFLLLHQQPGNLL